MTNFDIIKEKLLQRINALTVEGIAAKYAIDYNCESCIAKEQCKVIKGYEVNELDINSLIEHYNNCYKTIKERLESEADEDD